MRKINIIIYSILFILILILIINGFKLKESTRIYKYFNETIIVKIWSNNNEIKAFDEIDNIYKENENILIDYKEQYLNNLVKDCLEKYNIKKYYINMDNTILLSNNLFKVGLPDPIDDMKVSKIIKVKGKCISTYIKGKSSVTVVSDNNCEEIANNLLVNNINEELNYINNLDDVEAIFNINGKFIKSNNFKKYE